MAVVAGATQYLKSRAQQLDGTDGSSGGLFAGVGNGVAWMRNKVTGAALPSKLTSWTF